MELDMAPGHAPAVEIPDGGPLVQSGLIECNESQKVLCCSD